MSQYFMVEALINHIVKSPLDNPSTVGNSSAALGSVSTWRLSPCCETSKRPLAHHVTSPKKKDRMERGVLKWIHTLCGDGSSIFGECIVVSQVLNVWKCHMFWSALYNYIFILYIYIWAGTPTPPPPPSQMVPPPLWQGRGGFLSSQAMVYVVFIVHIMHMYRQLEWIYYM